MFNHVIAALLVIVVALIPIMGYTAADVDGLLIYLPMDEGQGNVAEDVSLMGLNDGKLIEAAKFVPDGKYGGAVELDGAGGSYVDMPWNDSMDVGADDFSTEIWFKYNTQAGAGTLIWGFNVGGGEPQFWIRTHPPNNITSLFWDGVEPNGPIVETPKAYNDDEWHHYAFVRRDDVLDIYVDGRKVGSGKGDEASVTRNQAFGIHLGQRVDGNNPYGGLLDEFRFWTRQLSEEEIKANMLTGQDDFLAVNPANSLTTTWGKIKTSR